MSSLHLEEPYQETGGDFKPYVHIRNQEFDINPHLDYGYSYNAIRENIAFEPELLIAALKIANSGTEVESSGQGKYHKGGVGDLSEGEPKRIIIKIWVSENTDRVVFTFLADGLMFAQIDAGEKSEEKLNDYRYDQLVFEYWEEEKKDKKKTPES